MSFSINCKKIIGKPFNALFNINFNNNPFEVMYLKGKEY
jgi:hypothetical protein